MERRSATGEWLVVPADSGQWESRDPEGATISVGGELSAARLGSAWIVGHAPETVDSIALWVQPPQQQPSSFRIELVFSIEVRPEWRVVLGAAARRRERVIRADLPRWRCRSTVTNAGFRQYHR